MAEFYPDDLVQEVIAANDIVDIISRYTQVKRSGSSYMALCPFHKERTPSLHISPDKQLYYCFGCGAGGTCVNFIMNIENLDFVEAIRYLAERANISLPEGDAKEGGARLFEKKKRLYEINLAAARFFHAQLLGEKGGVAREYIKMRSLGSNVLKAFGIGYAPDEWSALYDHLREMGFESELIYETGLALKNKSGRYYDRFRNRLMFPILDVRGNVIAFGGRIIGDGEPKYLNSPESAVFSKGRNLFGLNIAKKSKKGSLILCEGYMDVCSLHQYGFDNAVGALGTAFTSEQAQLLSRYTPEVFLCYDTDDAGVAATGRAIEVLSGRRCKVKVIELPRGKDPDEFLKTYGAANFEKVIENAKTVTDYRISRLKKQYNLENLEEKIEFVSSAAKILSEVENSIERDAYIKKIALSTEISSEAIAAEIKKHAYRTDKKRQYEEIRRQMKPRSKILEKSSHKDSSKLINAEKMLLAVIFSDRDVYNKLKDKLEGLFSEDLHKRLVQKISEAYLDSKQPDAIGIINSFVSEEQPKISEILLMPLNFEDNVQGAYDLLNTIEEEQFNRQIELCKQEGKLDELNRLIKLKNKKKGGAKL